MDTREYPFKRQTFYDRRDVAAALAPDYDFKSQRGSWGISGIVRFGGGPNYVFFVTFGQKQAGHEFDEAVYENGIVCWQLQPHQTFTDPVIQTLIEHNHLENDILLFLRTTARTPYAFMGFLKYISHDGERERPVYFQWQILDFDPTIDYERLAGLMLEPVPATAEVVGVEQPGTVAQNLVPTAPPRPVTGRQVEGAMLRNEILDLI